MTSEVGLDEIAVGPLEVERSVRYEFVPADSENGVPLSDLTGRRLGSVYDKPVSVQVTPTKFATQIALRKNRGARKIWSVLRDDAQRGRV
jgi:carbon monoxide dehydrogenase subunit G